jgi:hypothetical protein
MLRLLARVELEILLRRRDTTIALVGWSELRPETLRAIADGILPMTDDLLAAINRVNEQRHRWDGELAPLVPPARASVVRERLGRLFDQHPLPAIYDRTSHPSVSDRRKLLGSNLVTFFLVLRTEDGFAHTSLPSRLPWLPADPLDAQLIPTRHYHAYGCSGRFGNDEMDQLLIDVRRGLVSAVFIRSVDRWARCLKLGMRWYDWCAEREVPVLSAEEPETWFDRETFEQELDGSIQRYRGLLARLRKNPAQARKVALKLTNLSEQEFWACFHARQLLQQQQTALEVADVMNGKGVPPPGGGKWTARLVRYIEADRRFDEAERVTGLRGWA